MQDAEKMKEAGAKHQIDYQNSRAFYDNIGMLKVLESLMREKLENKPVKILDTEGEKRLEIMKKLLVQNTGIDKLQFQDINRKDLKFLNDNEVHNQINSRIQQNFVNDAISVLHLPTEGGSDKQSDDKNDVSASVTDEFVSILSEAYKDDPDVHVIPSMAFKNIIGARSILLDEVEKRNSADEILESADEKMLEEKLKQCISQGISDFFDVKMESSSSPKISLEGSTKIIVKLTQVSRPQGDHDKLSSQSTQVPLRKLKPEWLEKFVNRTFFEPCSEHPIRRNELNKYCIDCDASLCQYCVSLASHANHRLLKIYRHVYKDVVPLDEIEQHIDCSQIQPYRCNRQMVIALTPLPHSGSKSNEEATCQTCKRKLIEYNIYSYCSISCKAEAFTKKQNDVAPPFLMLARAEKNEIEIKNENENENQNEEPKLKSNRKRKGIPHRSPLS